MRPPRGGANGAAKLSGPLVTWTGREFAETLRLDNLFPHPERLVPFIGNHDTSRFMNDPSATLQKLQLAFTVLTTMRGMPQIYSGDEIAMHGGDDPDNRRDFPGGFSGAANNAFRTDGRTPEQAQAFDSLTELLTLRRTYPALQTGSEQVLQASNEVLVYARVSDLPNGKQRILVAVNKAKGAQDVSIPTEATDVAGLANAQPLLRTDSSSLKIQITLQPELLNLHLAPESAAIFKLEK